MPPSARRPARRVRVRFDDGEFGEDLAHASAAGHRVALAARRQLEADGPDTTALRGCESEGRDGTRLPGCVKLYLPAGRPGEAPGAWGMVFALRADQDNRLYLRCLAFGERHPTRASRPSVYQVADRRLQQQ